MNFGFLRSVRALLVCLMPIVPVVWLPTPVQNTVKDQAKASAGSAFEGEIMDNDCAEMGSHDMTMKSVTLATPDLCTSYCLRFKKTQGKLVLYDAATKTICQLDNQQEASFFAARKVKVTGTYDEATKTIHIKDITSVSAT